MAKKIRLLFFWLEPLFSLLSTFFFINYRNTFKIWLREFGQDEQKRWWIDQKAIWIESLKAVSLSSFGKAIALFQSTHSNLFDIYFLWIFLFLPVFHFIWSTKFTIWCSSSSSRFAIIRHDHDDHQGFLKKKCQWNQKNIEWFYTTVEQQARKCGDHVTNKHCNLYRDTWCIQHALHMMMVMTDGFDCAN